jgi:aspartyl-tRNA(Asn)/glutamyl-tRNA(Gln) amidotransferase subunit A
VTFAHEIAQAVNEQQSSAEEVVAQALERAKAAQTRYNAFITLAPDAVEAARRVDARIKQGERLPLAGVPVVVKDNLCTRGLRTTAASKSLEHFVPPYSATVIERLERAGAVVIAKANLDEFGMGSSNENSAFGPVKNPWDEGRVPGGSSGGSAVAVAAGVAPLALGTDTGGSVRQPASWCGLVGFKPTYGRLSRYGVIAFASSLDQVGVLSSSARDIELALGCMAGRDPNDATSLDAPYRSDAAAVTDLDGLKVGLVRELSGEGNSEGVLAALGRTVELLQSLGASVEEVSLPHARHGVAAYYLVAPAEASANLARFDGMLYSRREGENALGQAEVMKRSRSVGFGAEVKRRILVGTYALSAGYVEAYYQQALKVRRLIANECAAAFERVDLLLMPTTPTVAYRLGEKTGDPLSMYLGDVDTVLANLAGLPAVSFPAGLAEDGMPCGAQLLAPALRDERLLAVARVLEAQLGRAFAPRPPMV